MLSVNPRGGGLHNWNGAVLPILNTNVLGYLGTEYDAVNGTTTSRLKQRTLEHDPMQAISGTAMLLYGSNKLRGFTMEMVDQHSPLSSGDVTNSIFNICVEQSNTSATDVAYTLSVRQSIYCSWKYGTANGDAAATNFNPFNTDINTVRGQETGYATLNPLDEGHDGDITNIEMMVQDGSFKSIYSIWNIH